MMDIGLRGRGFPGIRPPYQSFSKPVVAFLSLDNDGYFISQRSQFDLGVSGQVSLAKVLSTGDRSNELLLATVGRRMFVLNVDSSLNVEKKTIESTTINGHVSEDSDSVLLPGYVSSWSGMKVDYDTEKGSLVISQGMTGITEITLL
jgi:hypothetical protein